MFSQYNHLTQQQENSWTFYEKGSSDWQIWERPNDCNMIHIWALGAGGGGSSGTVSCGLSAGGNGGASAGYVSLLIDMYIIPDIIYINVGTGGVGGAATTVANGVGNAGSNGGQTYVSMFPTTARNVALAITQAGGGAPGNSSCGNQPGGGVVIGSNYTTPNGIGNSYGGTGGLGWGSGSIGILSSMVGPGLSSNSSGLSATASTNFNQSVTTTVAGNTSFVKAKAFQFIGGSGGSSTALIMGNAGGNGNFGCGGGGGASSNLGGGAGGRGGGGMVIITAW